MPSCSRYTRIGRKNLVFNIGTVSALVVHKLQLEQNMSTTIENEFAPHHTEHHWAGEMVSLLKCLAAVILSTGLQAQATVYYVGSSAGSDVIADSGGVAI